MWLSKFLPFIMRLFDLTLRLMPVCWGLIDLKKEAQLNGFSHAAALYFVIVKALGSFYFPCSTLSPS